MIQYVTGMKRAIAVLLFLLGGCAHASRSTPETTEIPVILYSSNPNEESEEDVKKAASALAQHGLQLVIKEVVISETPSEFSLKAKLQFIREAKRKGVLHLKRVGKVRAVNKGDKVRGVSFRVAYQRLGAIASCAISSTLAHEIGHLLGLSHVEDSSNIMSLDKRKPDSVFSKDQAEQMKRSLQRLKRAR